MRHMILLALVVSLAACDERTPTAPELPSFARSTLTEPTLDQAQTVSDGYAAVQFGGAAAQTFTAGIDGDLSQVDLALNRTGNPGNLVVQIRPDSSGVPSSVILASSVITEGSVQVSESSFDWISVIVSPAVRVTAGTRYAIVLAAPDAPPCCDGYKWASSFQNSYSAGGFSQLTGRLAPWVPVAGVDAEFRTFVTALGPGPKTQCSDSRWKALGFENQGQCVRFFEAGKDSRESASL